MKISNAFPLFLLPPTHLVLPAHQGRSLKKNLPVKAKAVPLAPEPAPQQRRSHKSKQK
jgi:hypothetical protein